MTCPAEGCHQAFRVEVPVAEPIASLDMPPSVQQAAAPVQQAAAPVQQATAPPPHTTTPTSQVSPSRKAPSGAEERQTIHLKMFRRYPSRCLAYLLLVAAPASAGVSLILKDWPKLGIACLTLGALVLCRLIAWWLRMRRTTMTLTRQSCVLESGIFSRQGIAIDLPSVTDVQVKQGLLGRLLNVGDLVVSHDNGEMQQVVLMAVPAPGKIADRLHQGRSSSHHGLDTAVAASHRV